jgi:hypothetical protein
VLNEKHLDVLHNQMDRSLMTSAVEYEMTERVRSEIKQEGNFSPDGEEDPFAMPELMSVLSDPFYDWQARPPILDDFIVIVDQIDTDATLIENRTSSLQSSSGETKRKHVESNETSASSSAKKIRRKSSSKSGSESSMPSSAHRRSADTPKSDDADEDMLLLDPLTCQVADGSVALESRQPTLFDTMGSQLPVLRRGWQEVFAPGNLSRTVGRMDRYGERNVL